VSEASKKKKSVGRAATNSLQNIGMTFKKNIGKIGGFSEYSILTQNIGVI